MNFRFLLMILAAGAMLSFAADAAKPVPVIVELFTSEGCSSCPPADEVLTKLAGSASVAGAEVIALGEHVTYWDRLGWKDRFSQDIFTQRQEAYGERFRLGSVYTPQAVINGSTEVLGSDENRVKGAVAKAAKESSAKVELTRQAGDMLSYRVTAAPQSGEVFLAITESRLDTDVLRGENGGRKLRHTGVVRSIMPLRGYVGQTQVKLDKSWKHENLQYVVFVQDRSTKKIWGAEAIPAE